MDTKHTPGPWEFDEGNHGSDFRPGYGLLDSTGTTLGVHVSDGGLRAPSGASMEGHGRPEAEVIANAKLIAKCPEMYEALEKAAKAINKIACGPEATTYSDCITVAADALCEILPLLNELGINWREATHAAT